MSTITENISIVAAAFPAFIIVGAFLEGIIAQDLRGLVFFVCAIINQIINWLLKSVIWASKDPNALRPKDATDQCGDKMGMPSGHSQFIWFFAIFWTLYILYSNLFKNKTSNILSIICLIIIALIVALSRIYLECHTFLQVLVGSIVGATIGVISYICARKFMRK